MKKLVLLITFMFSFGFLSGIAIADNDNSKFVEYINGGFDKIVNIAKKTPIKSGIYYNVNSNEIENLSGATLINNVLDKYVKNVDLNALTDLDEGGFLGLDYNIQLTDNIGIGVGAVVGTPDVKDLDNIEIEYGPSILAKITW